MCKIKVIGKMDHTIDNTLESANRVYSDDGIAPTIPIATGDHCPKVLFGLNDKKVIMALNIISRIEFIQVRA